MSHQADYPDDLASMVTWVDSVATPGQRVLDVGCGDGSMVAVLTERYDAIGVDPGAEPGPTVIAVPFEQLDIAPVDVIVASLSLHHLGDTDAAVAALRRAAHPGTQLLVREFDRVRMDDPATLRWWFHQRQALDAVDPDPRDLPLPATFDEFVEWWRTMMQHHVRPWVEVQQMIAAAGFVTRREQWGPHLFRWGLGDGLCPVEQQLIDRGRVVAVGVRWHGVMAE